MVSVYTIVLSNPPGGRRIGMDPVVFDEEGYMSVVVTDTPQPAPLAKATDTPKSIPLTINKVRAMNALSKVSSEQFGFFGSYAVDNYSGTVWMPEEGDQAPSLLIELSPATRFDVVQLYKADGMRIMFGGVAPDQPVLAECARMRNRSTSINLRYLWMVRILQPLWTRQTTKSHVILHLMSSIL